MAQIPLFDDVNLRAICDVLGDTASGLSGSEIGQLLKSCGVDDVGSSQSKRHRLFQSLDQRQRKDNCGNHVVSFILAAMNPIRYTRDREAFERRRSHLNEVLSFCGLGLGEDGKLREVTASRTLSEAQERASSLRRNLLARNVHPDVLRFCRAELLQENYFHAVFEAAKSVADKIRERSGLVADGGTLVKQAFEFQPGSYPVLAFNSLQAETEKNEHYGLTNLLKGLFSTFRNTTAHAPKIKWVIEEQDALDMLSLASLLHRRLDEAVPPGPDC